MANSHLALALAFGLLGSSAAAQPLVGTGDDGVVSFEFRIVMDGTPDALHGSWPELPWSRNAGTIGFWLEARTRSTTDFNPGVVRASSPAGGATPSLIVAADPQHNSEFGLARGVTSSTGNFRGLGSGFRMGAITSPAYQQPTANGPMQQPFPNYAGNNNGALTPDGMTIFGFDAFIGIPRLSTHDPVTEEELNPYQNLAGANEWSDWQGLYRFTYSPGSTEAERAVTISASALLLGASETANMGGVWPLLLSWSGQLSTTLTFIYGGESVMAPFAAVPTPGCTALLATAAAFGRRRTR